MVGWNLSCYGSPVRIGVVTTWYPSRRSPGAGSFIARDVASLARGHEVRVLHLVSADLDDGERTFRDGDVAVVRVRADVRTPMGWLAARRAVRRFLPEVEVLHTMAAPALLPWLLRRPNRPWVHTEHWSGIANIAGTGRARLLRTPGRRAFAGPDIVVAVSGFLATAIRTMRGSGIEIIGNIVDPVPEPVRTVHDGLSVIAVGSIAAHKGWPILVEAVQNLRESGLDVRAVWVGDGPDRDALAQAIAAAGLRDRFRLTGHLDREGVQAELARADVFVLPTRLETFSLATVEALVAGCPVVVTGIGGHTDLVTAQTGRVVDRDGPAVAEGIRAVVASCDRDAVIEHGRDLAKRFSEQEHLASYTEIYEEVSHG